MGVYSTPFPGAMVMLQLLLWLTRQLQSGGEEEWWWFLFIHSSIYLRSFSYDFYLTHRLFSSLVYGAMLRVNLLYMLHFTYGRFLFFVTPKLSFVQLYICSSLNNNWWQTPLHSVSHGVSSAKLVLHPLESHACNPLYSICKPIFPGLCYLTDWNFSTPHY